MGKGVGWCLLAGSMSPEKMFQQVLALGEAWRVTRMDYLEKEQQVLIRVEETPALWAAEKCPHCARATVRGYDPAPERRGRHLNVCQLQSEIVCALPRGECQECRKVYPVRAAGRPPPGTDAGVRGVCAGADARNAGEKSGRDSGRDGSEAVADALRPCRRGVGRFELGERAVGRGGQNEPEEGS